MNGGLDLAVAEFYGATVAWHCEFDKHPSAVLERHFPDVPNLHDVTTVDWSAVEPVDIITGGYPCQPFSHAGNRKGTNDERHLWPYVADCLRVLRPRIAVFENVAGHLSLGFDAVLADLAEIGFDAEWVVVRASDAGAPHRRERLFIVATDARGETVGQWPGLRQSQPSGFGWGRPDDDGSQVSNLTLLPTPACNDMGAGKSVEQWDAWTDAMRAKHGNGNGRGVADALPGVVALLPTPAARDHKDSYIDNAGCHRPGDVDSVPRAINALLPTPRATRGGSGTETSYALGGEYSAGVVSPGTDFGPYAAAIARWEAVLGRPAPSPTEPGKDGRPRLSARFVEWLMGLPTGWVTDVDIPRSAQLKALGNGVVPAQALLALSLLEFRGSGKP